MEPAGIDLLKKELAEPPQFLPPDLVDEELIKLIAKRGAKVAKENKLRYLKYVPIGILAGFAAGYFGFGFANILTILFLLFAAGTAVGYFRMHQLNSVYQKRRYDQALEVLGPALSWNAAWVPFSWVPFLRCINIQLSIVMMQGRFIELEIISRYARAVIEPNAPTDGMPKNWAIANNLAVAWLMQSRFEQARDIFSAGLGSKLKPLLRRVLVQNLAICYARLGQIPEAEKALAEATALLGRKNVGAAAAQINLIAGIIQLEKRDLEGAEQSLEKARENKKVTPEFHAECTAMLARVLHEQGRLEEAELYFQNAIDVISSGENPNYISLAKHLHYYAQLLLKLGKDELAQKNLEKAYRYYHYFVDRETLVVSNIKARLEDPKRISSTAALLTLTKQHSLLEARD